MKDLCDMMDDVLRVISRDNGAIKPMPPVIGHGDTCGNCGECLADWPTRYCPWCGREIDWGDFEK